MKRIKIPKNVTIGITKEDKWSCDDFIEKMVILGAKMYWQLYGEKQSKFLKNDMLLRIKKDIKRCGCSSYQYRAHQIIEKALRIIDRIDMSDCTQKEDMLRLKSINKIWEYRKIMWD